MKILSSKTTQILIVSAIFAGSAMVARGATLQIDGPAGGDWDETQATQTGAIGAVAVEIVTSVPHWADKFQDENSPYASTFFGPLRQSTSAGDFMVIQTAKNFGVFTVTLTLQDTLTDPIIYLQDVDWEDAVVGFAPGADQTFATNGAFAGDIFTSDGTAPGGWGAALYSGTFGPGSSFEITFDYSNVTTEFSELVGLGVGTLQVVPVPAAFWLFGSALGMLGWVRRKTV